VWRCRRWTMRPLRRRHHHRPRCRRQCHSAVGHRAAGPISDEGIRRERCIAGVVDAAPFDGDVAVDTVAVAIAVIAAAIVIAIPIAVPDVAWRRQIAVAHRAGSEIFQESGGTNGQAARVVYTTPLRESAAKVPVVAGVPIAAISIAAAVAVTLAGREIDDENGGITRYYTGDDIRGPRVVDSAPFRFSVRGIAFVVHGVVRHDHHFEVKRVSTFHEDGPALEHRGCRLRHQPVFQRQGF
jgi:hypothetical protein